MGSVPGQRPKRVQAKQAGFRKQGEGSRHRGSNTFGEIHQEKHPAPAPEAKGTQETHFGKQKSKEVEPLPIHDFIDAGLGGETDEEPEPWLMEEDVEVMEALEDQEEGSDEQVEGVVEVAEEGEDAASSEASGSEAPSQE